MTTLRVPILNWSTKPDTGGDCFWQPYTILATNDVWGHGVWIFGASNAAAPTLRGGLYGSFLVPADYVGTAKIIIVWTATITSGNVVFDFDYRAVGGDNTESLDQSGTQESVSVTDAAPGAANRRLETSVNLTSANIAAGDTIQFYFVRDGTDAADTMAGSALLNGLYFQYSDA